MSKRSNLVEQSCTEKCRLKKHGSLINSVITNINFTDNQLACYLNHFCNNFSQVLDEEGRSSLHLAVSCGRRDLCHWLIKAGKGDINQKDYESGYTPLHRSIFYGYINIAVTLIEMGAQVQSVDKDDLIPSDHAMKDRFIQNFSVHNPCQVYVWGTNNNYTLGTGNQQSRSHPELLDFFRKNNISINQVAMDKFHSVFVSSTGRVWACGLGQGGRLGVDTEQTVLTPKPLRTGSECVVSASVGRNHTVLLMESGSVWTCGFNNHHVLGHEPPPPALLTPRPINPRLLKPAGGPIIGAAAARYHSVLWSETVVLTFGLNGGQLGFIQLQDKTIIAPRQVTGLNLSENYKIVDVAASVGATVVGVKKDLYLMNNYQIRKITSKSHQSHQRILDTGITKVAVFGGELSADLDPKLRSKGGEELRVLVLTSSGRVLLWQESFPQLTRCIHPLKRSLTFCSVSLNQSSALLVTKDGEAFVAHVKPKIKKKAIVATLKTERTAFNQFLEKLDCHHVTVSRVAHVHRAVAVSSDPKGQNFVVIQEDPKINLTDIPIVSDSEWSQQMASLLENVHEDDALHDIVIKVNNGSVAAHHFVLACVSEEFAKMPFSGSVKTVTFSDVKLQPLLQILSFAYTNDCEAIHLGPFKALSFEGDIVKATLNLAKKFKISSLIKCLQLLRYEEGMVVLKEGDSAGVRRARGERPKLERTMLPSLHDVAVCSNDGATFKAHKCLLSARLDYFNSMFTGGWIEAGAETSLCLPIPQNILREVIDFLYKDEVTTLVDNQDVDYISSVLVVADQLFINRLKQMCEVALCGNLCLRNTAYLLQLSNTYNADQLKNCCMQFICLNLAAVLETRTLEILDKNLLEEISRYYRNMIPAMQKRVITPYITQLTEEDIILNASSFSVPWPYSEEHISDTELQTVKINKINSMTSKKKITRSRKTSESQRKRFESNSSNSDLDCSVDSIVTEKMDFEDLVELPTKKTEKWVTVEKTQKIVQSRLKVITTASTVQPTPQEFTPLTSSHNDSKNPPLQIRDEKEFPDLTTQTKISSSPKFCSVDIKRSPAIKLSQKQRKRLLSTETPSEVDQLQSAPRSPWAPITNVNSSIVDIMNSLAVSTSHQWEQDQVRFTDIVAEEIKQRDNWSKMKSKSLELTQIEDKAMEELLVFYNAANIFDERISVKRVLCAKVATPQWITTRHQ